MTVIRNEKNTDDPQSQVVTGPPVAVGKSLPLAVMIAMLFGLFTGLSWRDSEPLHAAPQSDNKPAAFQSGGARSAKTLEEIKTILLRMESRLEKMEQKMGGGR